MHKLLFSLFCFFIFAGCVNKKRSEEVPSIQTDDQSFVIAFGSCNKHNKQQDLWDQILKQSPDLWIWLGDMVYGDTKDMTVLKEKYDAQNEVNEYKNFTAQVPIVGTWDDHDYGTNNGDKHYPQKAQSRDLALEFLGVDKKNEVWQRDGIYQSYTYSFNDKTIRLLLLDIRYFSDRAFKRNKKYTKDPKADILGEEQWAWLTSELDKEEDLLLIASGTQIIPEEHRFEKWANFPTSRKRLMGLLEKETTSNIVLLSGDRHLAEISKFALDSKDIYEITSSGLTHSYRNFTSEPNAFRIGQVCPKRNYGTLKLTNDSIYLNIHQKNSLHQQVGVAFDSNK